MRKREKFEAEETELCKKLRVKRKWYVWEMGGGGEAQIGEVEWNCQEKREVYRELNHEGPH